MNINPEFRRNLWLELSPYRLIGMPTVLGILLFLAYLLDNKQYGERVAHAALLLFGLLAFLWGTRLASEALIAEIRDHTWDGQRMSMIGPWSMTWGKLIGSTIYPWYGALLCLLVYLTSSPALGLSIPETAVLMIGSALLGQAIGLLTSLQAIRKSRHYSRFQTTAFLVLGVICSVSLVAWPFSESASILWYSQYFPDDRFVLISLLLFLGWAVFGIYRLIRAELQLQNLPWAWGLFILFMVGYLAGFVGEDHWATGKSLPELRMLSAFLVTLVLAYGMLFSERKDPVVLRRFLQYFGRREWFSAMQVSPLWLSTLPFVILSCAALVTVDMISGKGTQLAIPAVVMILFLLRDLGLLLFLNLSRNPKRADMLTVLFLVMLYGVIPTILAVLGIDRLAGLFWPVSEMPAQIALPAALGQAVVMLGLTVRRWRRSNRSS